MKTKISSRLKYIQFGWDDESEELRITTKNRETREVASSIVISKAYIFSTMRFMVRVAQRMWWKGWRRRRIERKRKEK